MFIVIQPGPGLTSFSKGCHIGNLLTNPCTPLGPLTKGSLVMFDGRLYRQELEVKGKGIIGILLRYGLKRRLEVTAHMFLWSFKCLAPTNVTRRVLIPTITLHKSACGWKVVHSTFVPSEVVRKAVM